MRLLLNLVREMKYNETHAIVLMKRCLGHVEWEEVTSVLTAPQYSVGNFEVRHPSCVELKLLWV
jgi:hypothetical protein